MIISGNTLYGTTYRGGSAGNGTVFAINTNGAGFTNLHNFTATSGSISNNSDGVNPYAGLILSGNTLFGTAEYGGSSGNGTVFRLNTNGTGFTNLHSFTTTSGSLSTNSDGVNPYAGLIISGNTLYGAAYGGGSAGNGTVFKLNTDGTGFTNLHSFTTTFGPLSTNSDGVNPYAGLILSGNTLYGTVFGGGSSGNGAVFAINTNGTGFTNLHNFTASAGSFPYSTNSDGADPVTGLFLSGNTLYGLAGYGGSSGAGTVFAINTDGTGFTNLHNFTTISGYLPSNNDGANPDGLILSGNTLYGTAYGGGNSGSGTIFSYSLGSSVSVSATPQMAIIPAGTNVILTWPTNAAGFTLQSTTNLASSPIWSIVSPPPVVVNGKNTVTNIISGTRKFYRLSQ